VKFRKEKYYAPSTGKTYLAPLPDGYHGEFGPTVKSLCLLFSHLCNVTEPKIADLLENFGIAISSGQISAWLTGAYPGIQEEKQAIVEAGLASSLTVPLYGGLSAGQHMDDTGTRVDGENYHCQILCNPLYGAYFTTARKDRLTISDVLRNGSAAPVWPVEAGCRAGAAVTVPAGLERGGVAAQTGGTDSGSERGGSAAGFRRQRRWRRTTPRAGTCAF
jgi:hypothetical protein